MKSAIITGATGAIGIALIHELIKRDVEVLVIARQGSKRNSHIPTHELVKVAYCPLDQYGTLLNEDGVQYDTFYHLAWDGTVGADRNNLKKQCDNVKYSIDAVQLAARYGCKTFVGIGSQAEYGRFEGKLTPDTRVAPETGYGIAKLCAGQMTREQAAFLNLRHIWVRVLSIYGPNDGAQSLVMSTIDKMRCGQTVQCTEGRQVWDYLYSEDAAEALYLLGASELNRKVYVLGGGVGRPLRQYIEEIRELVDPDANIEWGAIPYAPNQVMHLEADISSLTNDTGWSPKTEFLDGIKKLFST